MRFLNFVHCVFLLLQSGSLSDRKSVKFKEEGRKKKIHGTFHLLNLWPRLIKNCKSLSVKRVHVEQIDGWRNHTNNLRGFSFTLLYNQLLRRFLLVHLAQRSQILYQIVFMFQKPFIMIKKSYLPVICWWHMICLKVLIDSKLGGQSN